MDVRRREGGRALESEVVLHVWGNAVAAKGMLGDLNPLGDGPCRSLADNDTRVPKILPAPEPQASSLGSSLRCRLNQLEVRRWAMM